MHCQRFISQIHLFWITKIMQRHHKMHRPLFHVCCMPRMRLQALSMRFKVVRHSQRCNHQSPALTACN